MKRAVVWIIILLVALIAAGWLAANNPQARNMHAVKEWIESPQTQAAVEAFERESELRFTLRVQTRSQGILAVDVEGASAHRHEEILDFVQTLDPPRPVEMNLRMTDGTFLHIPAYKTERATSE